jgi:hypothetical protein
MHRRLLDRYEHSAWVLWSQQIISSTFDRSHGLEAMLQVSIEEMLKNSSNFYIRMADYT